MLDELPIRDCAFPLNLWRAARWAAFGALKCGHSGARLVGVFPCFAYKHYIRSLLQKTWLFFNARKQGNFWRTIEASAEHSRIGHGRD